MNALLIVDIQSILRNGLIIPMQMSYGKVKIVMETMEKWFCLIVLTMKKVE